MGLWRLFTTAKGMKWRVNTREVRKFLKGVKLDDIRNPGPLAEIGHARANYPKRRHSAGSRRVWRGQRQQTIGLNGLTSKTPFWALPLRI